MSAIAALEIHDLTPRLAVKHAPSRRPRTKPVTSVTLHYNGPRVVGFGNVDREINQIVNIDVRTQQERLGADSLMYHVCVLSDGSMHQTRDYELIAWHCRHSVGNEQSLAVHLPLGGNQDATETQWQATERLLDAFISDYRLAGRSAVRGHLEWAATECPGPNLMGRLRRFRAGAQPEAAAAGHAGMYRIRNNVSAALIRAQPTRQSDIRGRMWPGDRLEAAEIVAGEVVGSDDRWLRRADGWGFVHISLARSA